MTRLIVEGLHRLSSRPWLFVTGRLEGDALRIGDDLSLEGDISQPAVTVRAIELHGPPGRTTVAVDGVGAAVIGQGAVLVRPDEA
ncbi:hypothetical protein Aab01nite_37710 [Paractinoplanes abujensis]|uniref:Uncharacterized protein n=1 Tax=Paractinoplanes abujensis TaxID=882441 RepID=A0A7W7CTV7_9ACTN|nr:hypothetical protein [Actinoplanes abujensis]MBB4694604.1 hypothetical protein [Actinoplanes abujensis]GID20181.1 hypothetical protein Aab01nite_37710 [Actinoplanes abujensis]